MYFMYVSSDPAAIEVLEKLLLGLNHTSTLTAVANGFELIRFLQNVKHGQSYPDLILLTKSMRRLSGRELLELLKTDDIYRLIPVLMVLPEVNREDESYYEYMQTETILAPASAGDWRGVAEKMCTLCD